MGSWLVVSCHVLAGASLSCGDNGELFGSRATGGTGAVEGDGGTASGKGGAGVGNGGTSGAGATSAGSSGAGAGGRVGSGGQGGTAGGANAGTSGMTTTGGSGELEAGTGGLIGGGAASAGASNAGAGGTAGGGMCPTGCEVSSLASPVAACSSVELLWECGADHEPQEMLDAGCRDLATAIPRFCCPVESYAGCTSNIPCAEVATQAACDARTDCHSVFTDPHNCACLAIGCCARFSRCADGARANCDTRNVDCDAPPPYCEGPDYVVSVAGFCYEGCVRATDCAP